MSKEEILEESFSSDEDFDDEEDSEASSTDVEAKLKEEEVFDEEFFKCYSALKKKDSAIYDGSVKFFNKDQTNKPEEGADGEQKTEQKTKSEPKVTILDHQLNLKEDEIFEPEKVSRIPNPTSRYENELEEIKNSIKKVGDEIDSESDDDILVVKGTNEAPKSNQRSSTGEETIKQVWKDPDQLNEEEKFLRDYIVNKRYLPKEGFFSKDIDQLSDVEEEVGEKTLLPQASHRSDEKDFDVIARIPRNSTKSIRDMVEKKKKKEKRMKKLEKIKKKKKSLKNADFEDLVGDVPTKFRYEEIEPVDFGMTAEELLMATDEDDEKDKEEEKEVKVETAAQKKKKKKRRGLNHKKFAKTGVAPDRLLAYGLSKSKLKKSKLL